MTCDLCERVALRHVGSRGYCRRHTSNAVALSTQLAQQRDSALIEQSLQIEQMLKRRDKIGRPNASCIYPMG